MYNDKRDYVNQINSDTSHTTTSLQVESDYKHNNTYIQFQDTTGRYGDTYTSQKRDIIFILQQLSTIL